jgi:hypothetical protein
MVAIDSSETMINTYHIIVRQAKSSCEYIRSHLNNTLKCNSDFVPTSEVNKSVVIVKAFLFTKTRDVR